MKTVLITGTSSGIGLATALLFARKGWQVAATMRQPEKDVHLYKLENVRLFPLDVTQEDSIKAAVDAALQAFGSIDVVVNNAGYGAIGIFEKATNEQIQKQFATNTFGVMNVCRAIIPHFKQQRRGVIIDVSSMAASITFPMFSIYSASKFAVEGFSDALAFELKPFRIAVKSIKPGAIKTNFFESSMEVFTNEAIKGYERLEEVVLHNLNKVDAYSESPEMVARTIFKAATDGRNKLRYLAGLQSNSAFAFKKLIPNSLFRKILAGFITFRKY